VVYKISLGKSIPRSSGLDVVLTSNLEEEITLFDTLRIRFPRLLFFFRSKKRETELLKLSLLNILTIQFADFPGIAFTLYDDNEEKSMVIVKRQEEIEHFLYYTTHEAHHTRQRHGELRVETGKRGKSPNIPFKLSRYFKETHAESLALHDIPLIAESLPLKLDVSMFSTAANFEKKSGYVANLGFLRQITLNAQIPITEEAIDEAALNDDFTLLWQQLGEISWELFTGIAETLANSPQYSLMKQYDVLVTNQLLISSMREMFDDQSKSEKQKYAGQFRAMSYMFNSIFPREETRQIVMNVAASLGILLTDDQVQQGKF